MLFSGDFAPVLKPEEINADHFESFQNILLGVDCHITNLECPLTSNEKRIDKIGPSLKAPNGAIKLLKQARVDVACLANNHSFDYGETGLRETIDICEQNGIDTVGIVNRTGNKKLWLIKEIDGKKIGFINCCEHEFSVREEGKLGANGYDPIRCFYEISALRPQVDWLFVIYHGGNEYYPLPRPGLKTAFHYLADLGADAVIGHHTHVISGYEIYKGKSLIYSLGNLFFPCKGESEEWYLGMLGLFTIDRTIQFELIPFEQCRSGLKVELLSEQTLDCHKKNIACLSKIIADDDSLRQMWGKCVHNKASSYLKQIPGISFIGKILHKLGFPLNRVLPYKSRLLTVNLLRCQSHFELLVSSFKELKK